MKYEYVDANSSAEAIKKARLSLGQVVGEQQVVAINAERTETGYYTLTYSYGKHDAAAEIAAMTQFVFDARIEILAHPSQSK